MLEFSLYLITRLVYSYPIKKFIKYIFQKLGFKNKQLFLVTFITSVLVTAVLLNINGITKESLIRFIYYIIAFSYWYLLDRLSLNFNSKFIKVIDDKVFRFFFGVLVFCLIFMMTMVAYNFDKYYLTPLVITISYMVFVYRKRSSGRMAAGEYRIKPDRNRFL